MREFPHSEADANRRRILTVENRIVSSNQIVDGRPLGSGEAGRTSCADMRQRRPQLRSVALDVAALAGAILRIRSRDPALPFAGVLPFAAVPRALAGTLAFAAIRPYTFYIGLIFLGAAVLRHHRLRRKHQPDHRREDRSTHFNPVHVLPSVWVTSMYLTLCTRELFPWIRSGCGRCTPIQNPIARALLQGV
jgi:hypothetical protein